MKWKLEPTENGLRVPHRHNLFCVWNTALVALEAQRRAEAVRDSLIELSACVRTEAVRPQLAATMILA